MTHERYIISKLQSAKIELRKAQKQCQPFEQLLNLANVFADLAFAVHALEHIPE